MLPNHSPFPLHVPSGPGKSPFLHCHEAMIQKLGAKSAKPSPTMTFAYSVPCPEMGMGRLHTQNWMEVFKNTGRHIVPRKDIN